MKLQEQKNGQKMVTIPRNLVDAMGWDKGEELRFSVKDEETLELCGK